MTTSVTTGIDSLIAESDIVRLLTRYAWSVDDKLWNDWAACFTDDAIVTMPFASHTGRAGLAAWAQAALEPFDVTHHLSTNHEIVLDGDRARARSKFQAVHVANAARTNRHFIEAGSYLWDLARVAGGEWLIKGCTLDVSWTAGHDITGLAGAPNTDSFDEC